ncbi:MAG TPA: Nramp family divalent metal transporter, partial [Flavitalea sp.]|nr:Nramp family divalent metal transporter [Flavitalea sp.]
FCLYILAEIAIAATDLAEVLGMAIGIHLLTGMPLIWGVAITVLDTLLLLFLQRLGMRTMEIFIIGLVAIIGFSFLFEILLAGPDLGKVARGFIPAIPNDEALYIAIGIIGATVMPHNLYLHSALVQTRRIKPDHISISKALKWNFIDSAVALNIAFLVNTSILVLAATVFFTTGRTDVAEIKDAHQLLAPLLGSSLAPIMFAVALIAAGQSSTVTGTLAGQIVMEGYLHLKMNPLLRRLLTRLLAIIPAMIVIGIYGENELDALLIFSQVVLSMQLGFAVIPLIHFVSDKAAMGRYTIGTTTKILSWIVAAILVALNMKLLMNTVGELFSSSPSLIVKTSVITGALLVLALLLYVIVFPFLRKKKRTVRKSVPEEVF